MRFISLFAGIGGFDLGLERAGHKCVAQVEIDPFCRKVLAKHWPNVPKFGDIRGLTGKELPEADLWCGGFPCQDISNAGKRAGIHGERSGLFFDFMRLVRVVRPRFLLLENVAAILYRGMGEVLGDLAASGYDSEWERIPAAALGAVHIRERVFLVGVDSDFAGNGFSAFGAIRPKCEVGPNAVYSGYRTTNWWQAEPRVVRVVDGFPGRVDRVEHLGNAVVPQVAEYIGRLLGGRKED